MEENQNAMEGVATGRIKLQAPITAAGKRIEELAWDFNRVTGLEFADAMDNDKKSSNAFKISDRQALWLFAFAAAKATESQDENGKTMHPLDAQDIVERIGIADSIKAVQYATVFFVVSSREGDNHITKI